MSSLSASTTRVEILSNMIWGFRNTQAIYVVSKLGVPDLLKKEGSMNSEEIAKRLGSNPRALYRVMRALASVGIFSQDKEDEFGLTAMSDSLRSDVVDSMRYFVEMLGEEHYRAMGDLLYTVKTGETAFNHIYGTNLFGYLGSNPEASATFNAAMRGSGTEWRDLPNFYDFNSFHKIIDVGGGNGALISTILRANPDSLGILYDLPNAVSEAEGFLKSEGVLDRCEVVAGDAFSSVPRDGDLYLMSALLHAFQDDNARKILVNCHSSIQRNGRLLVIEHVLPEGDAPHNGKMFDLVMLAVSGGMERTKVEWQTLFRSSGFELNRVIETSLGIQLIEARPA